MSASQTGKLNDGLYVGLLSGTSMDGIDAALLRCQTDKQPTLLATHSEPFNAALRQRLLAIAENNQSPIDEMLSLHSELAAAFSASVNQLLAANNISPEQVSAIGSHGQTIFHRPAPLPAPFSGNTLQLGDASKIAALTGVTTVADFRHADMAYGGQGAPLAPLLHQNLFGDTAEPRAVLNLGGIANLTLLPTSGEAVSGYDTGPASTLMDSWILQHKGETFDHEGEWAASGSANKALLKNLLSDPYFALSSPKSTGTDYFNTKWLEQRMRGRAVSAVDVMTTLCELTARSIAESLTKNMPECQRLIVCGGGALNIHLMSRLSTLTGIKVVSSQNYGLDPQWIEAILFGWLAYRRLAGLPGNMPSVTGASKECLLGAVHANT